jgi:SAM-dependent methyltransferase
VRGGGLIPQGYQVTEDDNPHLAGFIHGGDPGTWCPAVWTRLIAERGIRSVLDLGCGEGQSLDWFLGKGVDAWGVDGSEAAIEFALNYARIVRHDFTNGAYQPKWQFDLCWCAEFVEHMEPQYLGNLKASFQSAKIVAMTHAAPGQEGWHHVNCQDAAYWIERMDEFGFGVDMEYSESLRWSAPAGTHVARSLLVFERKA